MFNWICSKCLLITFFLSWFIWLKAKSMKQGKEMSWFLLNVSKASWRRHSTNLFSEHQSFNSFRHSFILCSASHVCSCEDKLLCCSHFCRQASVKAAAPLHSWDRDRIYFGVPAVISDILHFFFCALTHFALISLYSCLYPSCFSWLLFKVFLLISLACL